MATVFAIVAIVIKVAVFIWTARWRLGRASVRLKDVIPQMLLEDTLKKVIVVTVIPNVKVGHAQAPVVAIFMPILMNTTMNTVVSV